ncbi:MAG: hypothetical protein ACJASQ_002933 [Crocinitomicaceae bacterium]|jgi:hypothetical protein
MNRTQSNNSFWTGVVTVVLAGAIVKLVADIFSESRTDIISDKGLQAINDPEKKKEIDEAFAESVKIQKETGVWENPVVDLN